MTLLSELPKTVETDSYIGAPRIREVLNGLGIRTSRVETEAGLRVSMAHVKLEESTLIKHVRSITEDLSLRLGVHSVRVRSGLRPGFLSLELSHDSDSVPMVSLGDLLPSDATDKMALPWAMGLSASGSPFVVDLADAPHVLIGGQTGSGKSSHLHALISSLALLTSPKDVELIFVDPKQVDLVLFRDLPHVRRNPITTLAETMALVQDLEDEVEFRYQEFAAASVADLDGYNAWARETPGEEPMPRLVLIADELSMFVSGKEGEALAGRLTRLAQICRAAGLHLVLATQRPSSSSMPTQLRSQLTTRIACRMATVSDSRMILDAPGAEKLLGAGDTLVRWGGADPVRVQGTYVSKSWGAYITDSVLLEHQPELQIATESNDAEEGALQEVAPAPAPGLLQAFLTRILGR